MYVNKEHFKYVHPQFDKSIHSLYNYSVVYISSCLLTFQFAFFIITLNYIQSKTTTNHQQVMTGNNLVYQIIELIWLLNWLLLFNIFLFRTF